MLMEDTGQALLEAEAMINNNETNTSNLDVTDHRANHNGGFRSISVRAGLATSEIRGPAVQEFSELGQDPAVEEDGLYWKQSEFHRRSGKQGLEERFKLLSPTIIVSCSGILCTPQMEHMQGNVSNKAKTGDANASVRKGKDKRKEVENIKPKIFLPPVVEKDASNTQTELRINGLRKRKHVDYFPKQYYNNVNADKTTVKPLTVRSQYQEELELHREDQEMYAQNECLTCPFESSMKLKFRKSKNLNKLPKPIRSNVVHLRQTKTVLQSLPDTHKDREMLSDSVTVTTYINGDLHVMDSVCSGRHNTKNCFVDALNGLVRCDIVHDFEIIDLLEELGAYPKTLSVTGQEQVIHVKADGKCDCIFHINTPQTAQEEHNFVGEQSNCVLNNLTGESDTNTTQTEHKKLEFIGEKLNCVQSTLADESDTNTSQIEQEKQELNREHLNCVQSNFAGDIDLISQDEFENYKINSHADNMLDFTSKSKLDGLHKSIMNSVTLKQRQRQVGKKKPAMGRKVLETNKGQTFCKNIFAKDCKEKQMESKANSNVSNQDTQVYFKGVSERAKSLRRRKRKAVCDTEEVISTGVLAHLGKENLCSQSLPVSSLRDIQTEPLNLSNYSCHDYTEKDSHLGALNKKNISVQSVTLKSAPKTTSNKLKGRHFTKQKTTKNVEQSTAATNRSKRSVYSSGAQKELTRMQFEPLNLSIHTEKKLVNKQASGVTSSKRILRNHTPITYFPRKKHKTGSKIKCIYIGEMVKSNHSGCAETEILKRVNSKGCCYSNDAEWTQSHSEEPLPLSLEPMDLSTTTASSRSADLEIKMQQQQYNLSGNVVCDIRNSEVVQNNLSDPNITESNTDKSKTNNDNEDCNKTESITEVNEMEKASNVHSALVCLYAAESSRAGKRKSVLNGSNEFFSDKEEHELDEYGNFQNGSYSQNEEFIMKAKHLVKTDLGNDSTAVINNIICTSKNILQVTEKIAQETLVKESATSLNNLFCGNKFKENKLKEVLKEGESVKQTGNDTVFGLAEKEHGSAEYEATPLSRDGRTNLHLNCNKESDNERKHLCNTENRDCVVDLTATTSSFKNSYRQLLTKVHSRKLTSDSGSFAYTEKHAAKIQNDKNTIREDSEREKDVNRHPKIDMSYLVKDSYPEGTVVWGRFSRARWWPAVTVAGKTLRRETKQGREWVFWLSDNRVSQLKKCHIQLFSCHYKQRTSGKLTESMKIGILKALKICAERAEVNLSSSQSVEEWGQSTSGFLEFTQKHDDQDLFPPDEASPLPSYILEHLGIIKQQFVDERRVTVLDRTGVNGLDDSGVADLETPKEDEDNSRKKGKRRTNKTAVVGRANNVCLSCDLPLKDDYQVYNHLLFEGLMCKKCKDTMMSSFHAIDDDGCSLFCGICGEGGKQFVCEQDLCGRAFCHSCIKRLLGQELLAKIVKTDPWYCFLCTSYSFVTHGSLVPRKDWQLEVVKFFQTDNIPLCNDMQYLTSEQKRKIRVLSLYDGIGTGKVVLNELGLDVEVYYASEINPDAMLVASYHHGVTHVGDASLLTRAQLIKMCPIDLVIAGPPCNDLSIVNPLRKGFNGTGMLLMKFISILKDVEALSNGRNHVFWLLENTGSMLTNFKQVICTMLGTEPAVWDAKYFTGQRRARNFWGNIPGLYSTPEYCKQLQQEKKDLDTALISNCGRKALVQHMRTVTTGTNSLTIRNGEDALPIHMNGVEDGIWVMELEKLFGFPEHYTDVGHLSLATRHRLLGKAWCVPVIKHILSPLRQYFAIKET